MSASTFISRRLSFKGRAATVSIAVSFLVMIIAVAIADGFRAQIRSSLASLQGDFCIRPVAYDGQQAFVQLSNPAFEEISALDYVDSLCPAVYQAGVVKAGDDIHGVMFKGVNRGDSLDMSVAIPSRLASLLSLEEGDRLLSYFVTDGMSVRNFTVREVYDGIVTSADKLVVVCDINVLRRLSGMDEGSASVVEVMLRRDARDANQQVLSDGISYCLYEAMRSDENLNPLYCSSLVREYPQMFDWLNLIDNNVALIIALMIIVAAFNMVTGLLIILFENISTIGLLKSLGMDFRGIAKTFLLISARVVLTGMLVGTVLALGFCAVQGATHLIPLSPESYFISFVPVEIDLVKILLWELSAFVIVMTVLLIPCRFISKVDPAISLRQR